MKRLGIGVGVLIAAASVQAATVSHGPYSIALSSTNWTDSISVPQFDPGLGTLTQIDFSLSGHVEGSAKFESLDASPATVDMALKATITLQRPDLSSLVTVIPVANTSDNVAAFDGTMDFGGVSGKTYTGLSGDDVLAFSSPPPLADLALFTGLGSINLPVSATGTSIGSGAGNLITQFLTSASAEASVTYHYDPVPEPASLALLAAGGLMALRRRR